MYKEHFVCCTFPRRYKLFATNEKDMDAWILALIQAGGVGDEAMKIREKEVEDESRASPQAVIEGWLLKQGSENPYTCHCGE
jgi:BRCT domain type II-containing protein